MNLHSPPASLLLDIWERGQTQPPVQRALALLIAATTESSPEQLASLSIGQRDACLLRLREQLFGPRLSGVVACAQCGERLELTFAVGDVEVDAAATAVPAAPAGYSLTVADYTVGFRLPNSLDLLALATADNSPDLPYALLERCIVSVSQDGQPRTIAETPAGVLDAVVQRMAQIDAQADVQLALTCPACDHRWLATFDILSYLWGEIEAWARRTLQEVHLLASVYGWHEQDILALTPWRRQSYLNLISG